MPLGAAKYFFQKVKKYRATGPGRRAGSLCSWESPLEELCRDSLSSENSLPVSELNLCPKGFDTIVF